MNRPKWVHTRSFQRLKNLFFAVSFRIGLFDLVRALSNGLGHRAVILCYHRVVEGNPDPYSIPGTQADLQRFTDQVRGLFRKYRIIPFSVLVEKLKKGVLDPNDLVLSFDDGFRDNATLAYPVLKRYGVAAFFFVSPATPGRSSLIWNNRVWWLMNRRTCGDSLSWNGRALPLGTEAERIRARDLINQTLAPMKEEEREAVFDQVARALGSAAQQPEHDDVMMRPEEISGMIAGGLAEFGSHSLTHPLLPLCDEHQLRHEVLGSKKALEEALGRPVAHFAYPGGAYDEKTLHSVRNAGYEAAVTTREGLVGIGDDPFLLPRVNVVRDDTLYSLMIRKLVPLYWKNAVFLVKKRLYGRSRD
ncbi:MAG: polysaccharide deacetylase family protein [Desulfobacterota bacterium]|nr:polysaccharide deacetylase family protein [Thermodesulfobacteriota bacterium]